MKVLILNHNQERFGTYFRCFYLAKYLAKNGVQISMICASGRSFDLGIRKIRISENFIITTLPRIKYHKYFTGQIFRLILTIPIILFSKYDILHAFTVAQPQIGIPAILSKLIRRKPLLVDWDDLWGGGFADVHGGLVSRILGYFEINVPKYADRITYVSEYLGKRIQQLGYANKSVKILNGANTDEIKLINRVEALNKLKLDGSYKYIVSVGNTYFENGLKFMFKTIHRLETNKLKVKLIMVGVTDILPVVRKLYEAVKNNIIITGPVDFTQVLNYYSISDMLILPMENNSIENARFPIRLGEYLACGKPILSNATGEVKYILNLYKCGLIIPTNDIEHNINKLNKYFKGTQSNYNINAFRAAKDLSWRKMANKLYKVYKLYA
jgi:glycosyltransferase involved in cell wall biosynthesis